VTAAATSAPDQVVPAPDVQRARRGTAAVFAVHGCVTGSFAARIPWIASHVGVGVGHLGIALLMPGIGALLAMPFSGRLAHRFALRPFVTATVVALCACLVLPTLPTSLAALCAVLLVFGAVAGLADMAMNAEGVLVEKLFGRSVMSSLHGFWSVGVLVGSVVSALASHAAIDTRVQFAVEALVLATVGAAVAQLLVEDPTTTNAPAPPHFALPTRPVLLIGLVGLCAVFGEQAGTDWSAFYIRNELDGSASVAALAVSAFAVAMATVRLMGDRVVRRLGPVRTVRISGACAFVGAVAVAHLGQHGRFGVAAGDGQRSVGAQRNAGNGRPDLLPQLARPQGQVELGPGRPTGDPYQPEVAHRRAARLVLALDLDHAVPGPYGEKGVHRADDAAADDHDVHVKCDQPRATDA